MKSKNKKALGGVIIGSAITTVVLYTPFLYNGSTPMNESVSLSEYVSPLYRLTDGKHGTKYNKKTTTTTTKVAFAPKIEEEEEEKEEKPYENIVRTFSSIRDDTMTY